MLVCALHPFHAHTCLGGIWKPSKRHVHVYHWAGGPTDRPKCCRHLKGHLCTAHLPRGVETQDAYCLLLLCSMPSTDGPLSCRQHKKQQQGKHRRNAECGRLLWRGAALLSVCQRPVPAVWPAGEPLALRSEADFCTDRRFPAAAVRDVRPYQKSCAKTTKAVSTFQTILRGLDFLHHVGTPKGLHDPEL